MTNKIGLMVGREWSFPPAFVEEVAQRDGDWEVEYLKLGTPVPAGPQRYPLIVDRISHAVPFYRSYLKQATLSGVRVINDPFVEATTDRFVAAAIARSEGIATLRVMALPHREYAEGIIHEESLRNLDYPLDWQAVADHVGLPCLLKDANGHGDPRHICRSVDEILDRYNQSGQRMLIVQQTIDWERYVRCFVIGRGETRTLDFDPGERRYRLGQTPLQGEIAERISEDSRRLTRALGFDINVVDWAIRDGEAWAVELMDPTPDIDIYKLSSEHFEWVVGRIADLAIEMANETSGLIPSEGESSSDLAEDLPSLARDLPHSDVQHD